MKTMFAGLVLLASTAAFAAPKKGTEAKGGECTFAVAGNDQMKFVSVKDGKEEALTEIKIPEKCKGQEIKFVLTHTGKLPKTAMGHNIVIIETAKQQAIGTEGMKAGPAANYLPAKADGLVAGSHLVGGGESTELKLAKGSFKDGTDYSFICTFPGHIGLMHGKIVFVK